LPDDEAGTQRPDLVAEVRAVFERYEQALRTHDIEALNGFFVRSPDTVRFGLAEQNYGYEAIAAYRRGTSRVSAGRQLRHTVISTFGENVACVSTEFTDPAMMGPEVICIGRQTQTWVRTLSGWKILAAHVSASKATR
jgi:ketosteroid isomerase-like protein